jgi:signal transduction histidine kinase
MRLDLLTIVAFTGSILYFIGIVLVIWRRAYHPKAVGWMLLYLFVSLVWTLGQALWRLGVLNFLADDFLTRVPGYGLFLMAVLFFFLSKALLQFTGKGLVWWITAIGWLAGLVVVDVNLIALPEQLVLGANVIINRQALASLMLIFGWILFMGGSVLLTIQAVRRMKPARFYAATSYWMVVLSLMLIGDGLFFASYQAPGMAVHLLGSMLAVYIISMPRLPEFGHILRRSINYLVFTAVAIAIYAASFIVAQLLFRSWFNLSPLLVGLILASVLVVLLNPLVGRIQKEINIWIAGDVQDPTYILRQYSQSITNILDLQLLITVIAGTLSELLEIRRIYLFLVDSENGQDDTSYFELRGVKGMGEDNLESIRLVADSLLVTFFRGEHTPVTQSELDFHPRFRDLSAEERIWLSDLGMEIYVPIYTKNEWIGLLVLGPKGSGAAYTRNDIALLSTLADQTAVALENTRLVEGLVRLNNDYRRAYSALDQANRHLEKLDRTKSDFISIASHELRTPLTLITGSGQMLMDDPDLQENAYYKQLLAKLETGTARLREIVDTMLDMAKVDTRALELERQPISLGSLIEDVAAELRKSVDERKQQLEVDNVMKGLPSISVDGSAMRKVFYHLIVNAIKYTPDEGRITITGRVLEPNLTELPKGGVEIVVSDTGIGIDPRYQELIFVKFYQTGEIALHSSGKTKFKGGGPGLGLAISKGIVEAHHGKIWVESPGYDEVSCPGSQFHVVLPLRQPAGEQLFKEPERPALLDG